MYWAQLHFMSVTKVTDWWVCRHESVRMWVLQLESSLESLQSVKVKLHA